MVKLVEAHPNETWNHGFRGLSPELGLATLFLDFCRAFKNIHSIPLLL